MLLINVPIGEGAASAEGLVIGMGEDSSRRGGCRLEAFTDVLCATITIESARSYDLNLRIGHLVEGAPYLLR